MKVYYTVNYQGVVEISEEDWNESKEDYKGNINDFAMVTICEEIGFYNEEAITINHMEI